MALGDVDKDNDLDIYLANSSGGDQVWLNDSLGVFTDSGQRLGPSGGNGHPALGDLDGDDDLDVFVTNSDHGSRVYINDGAGLFTDSGQTLGSSSQKVCLVDLDNNGSLDAITTHIQNGNPIWLNNGAGLFTDSGLAVDSLGVLSICSGDVDQDDRADLLVGKLEGYGGNELFYNQTEVPARPSSWGRLKALFERE